MAAEKNGQHADANDAKAVFDDIYNNRTPHAYLNEMRRLGYQIAEQARPYGIAAAEFIARETPTWPVQMLDVGCSYGIGSAFVRFGCSFEEFVSFFNSRAPRGYPECTAATRAWLGVVAPAIDMRVVGLDASENALRFALDAGLLDAGIARDAESEDLTDEERAWVSGCNLLVSTGAIGYVGKATFRRILQEMGRSHPSQFGPLALMTALRMFDVSGIAEAFAEAGYAFERLPGVLLPQRAFASEQERRDIIDQVRARGLDTTDIEESGVLYADLYTASPKELQPKFRRAMQSVTHDPPIFSRQVEVANLAN